jgi:hypothetical protein
VNDAEACPVRLILDTSAIAAFARGSIHVGEVLAEIADEHAVALLPLACLVEAVHGQRFTNEEDARLDLHLRGQYADASAAVHDAGAEAIGRVWQAASTWQHVDPPAAAGCRLHGGLGEPRAGRRPR